MPRVPISKRQVREKTFQTRGVSAKMPAVGLDQEYMKAVGKLGNQVIDFIQEERDKADHATLTDLEVRARNKKNDILHNAENGYLFNKGVNARDGYQSAEDSYADFWAEEEKKPYNERLKKKFETLKMKYQGDLSDSMQLHMGREMNAYHVEQVHNGLNSLAEDAKLNYDLYTKGSSQIDKAVGEQTALVNEFKHLKGLSYEQAEEMLSNATSKLHYNVITQRLNNGEDLVAKDYYKEAKRRGEIDGDTVEKLDKILHASGVKGESQRQAAEIMAAGLGYNASIEMARQIKDPEVQDATVQRVKSQLKEQDYMKTLEQNSFATSLKYEIDKRRTADHIPSEELIRFPKAKRGKFLRYASMKQQGIEPTTKANVKMGLLLMASNPARKQEFVKKDLTDHILDLNDQDFAELEGLQRKLMQGKKDKDTEEKLGRIRSNDAVMNSVLGELKITDNAAKDSFKNIVTEQAEKWQIENGKIIPNSELKKISEDMAIEIEVKGGLIDPDKRLYEVEPEEAIVSVDYETIPARERSRIMKMMRRSGVEPDEKSVIKQYLQDLAKRYR